MAPKPNYEITPPSKASDVRHEDHFINPFETKPIVLTVLEWRYVLHVLNKGSQNEAQESYMNAHAKEKIEEAISKH